MLSHASLYFKLITLMSRGGKRNALDLVLVSRPGNTEED